MPRCKRRSAACRSAIYRSAGARLAFLGSARSIYLDPPFARDGLFPRMEALVPPALFVWGSHDKLIPPGFRRHVERWLPGAEQIVLDGCGHVPQVERPERTNGLLVRFFARIDALGAATQERVAAWAARGMRVLLTTRGSSGHLGPLVPFARACLAVGHEVLVAAPGRPRANVERARLPFASLGDLRDDDWMPLLADYAQLDFEAANARMVGKFFGRPDTVAPLPGVARPPPPC